MLGKFQKKKSFLSTKRNGDPDGQNPAVSTAKPSLLPMGRGGGNLTDGIAQTLMDESFNPQNQESKETKQVYGLGG